MPASTSVEEYLASFPPDVRRVLADVRAALRSSLPDAEERISYGIPTFSVGGRYVVYFSGWKRHVSVYPLPHPDPDLDAELEPYRAGKGTLRFPLDEPMPLALIQKVATRLLEQRIGPADARSRPGPKA